MFDTRTLLMLVPALPLLAAVVTAALGPRYLRQHSHWPAVVAITGAFLCSVPLAWQVYRQAPQADAAGYEQVYTLWQWARVPAAHEPGPPWAGQPAAADRGQSSRDFDVAVALRADTLTAAMLLMVTLVSSLVTIYSIGYMRGDPGYWRFFAYVSLFVFSMTMLVSVSNFAMLYVFWEAVGVCSYLLIGFWYQKPAAAAAGMKAFLVNRVGDFGFALAVFLIWTVYGTLNFHDAGGAAGVLGQQRLLGHQPLLGGGTGLAICLLLLLGACGKSAQFPLHVWLPDAMEGPTPVSALIHAATMVTAGVYMIARCTPLLMVSPESQLAVSAVGGLTAILAAIIALTQFDLKRVLAYSTISQLGLMFVGLGAGTLAGITAGMFHLLTHAFFKALLFLGAGSVMHAMGGEIDMRQFGGLRRKLPITHWTFAVGCLALAGVVPLAGFWSKDAILGSLHDKIHLLETRPSASRHAVDTVPDSATVAVATMDRPGHVPAADAPLSSSQHVQAGTYLNAGQMLWGYRLVQFAALLTTLLTALYAARAFFLTFYGPQKIPESAGGHAHESPPVMWVPLAILAAFALLIGWVLHQTHGLTGMLRRTPMLAYEAVSNTPHPGAIHMNVALLSTLLALSGVGLGAYLYLGVPREVMALKSLFDLEWLRDAIQRVGVRPLSGQAAVERAAQWVGLGWLIRAIGYVLLLLVYVAGIPLLLACYISPYKLSVDKFYFDEIYDALFVRPLRAVAGFCYVVDRLLIDGLVNACGRIPLRLGQVVRPLQMGLIPFYGLASILGIMLVLILARVLWGGG